MAAPNSPLGPIYRCDKIRQTVVHMCMLVCLCRAQAIFTLALFDVMRNSLTVSFLVCVRVCMQAYAFREDSAIAQLLIEAMNTELEKVHVSMC